MHGTHTLDGHHQQRSRRRAAEIHRTRKTGSDPPAAIEHLTKQNQDLEEQLRQRDAGHNVQEENQGDSSERKGHERPEGSNEPSRPERRNLSMPSLMDTAPPPILAEIQAMKEKMEVMMTPSRDVSLATLTI